MLSMLGSRVKRLLCLPAVTIHRDWRQALVQRRCVLVAASSAMLQLNSQARFL